MSQLGGLGAQRVLLPQQDQLGHTPGQDRVGRGQDARVIALGQHDALLLAAGPGQQLEFEHQDRKSTRLNSSHVAISYAVFCLKKKKLTKMKRKYDNY